MRCADIPEHLPVDYVVQNMAVITDSYKSRPTYLDPGVLNLDKDKGCRNVTATVFAKEGSNIFKYSGIYFKKKTEPEKQQY